MCYNLDEREEELVGLGMSGVIGMSDRVKKGRL